MSRKWFLDDLLDQPKVFEEKVDHQEFVADLLKKVENQNQDLQKQALEEGYVKGMEQAVKTNTAFVAELAKKIESKIDDLSEKTTMLSEDLHMQAIKIAREFWVKFFPKIDELIAQDHLEGLVKEAVGIHQESHMELFIHPTRFLDVSKWIKDSGMANKIKVFEDENLEKNDSRIEWANGGMDYVSKRLFDKIELELKGKKED